MPDLEGDVVTQTVLLFCDLLHFLLDVLLRSSLYIDVVTIPAGVVAGDGLGTRTSHYM